MVANLVPDEPGFNLESITPLHGTAHVVTKVVRIDAVDAIPVGMIPSNAQICAESRRYMHILAAYLNGGQMTETDVANSIVRHHRVLHTRSVMEPNVPNVTQRLTQIVERLTQIDERLTQIDQGFAQMNRRFDLLEARSNANTARFSNIFACAASNWRDGMAYVPVVKYTPEHPFLPHPNLPGVHFDAVYPVGSLPPANLMPLNFGEFVQWKNNDTVVQLRRKIKGIYWFYNDQRFHLPDNATLLVCRDTLSTLDDFLRYP